MSERVTIELLLEAKIDWLRKQWLDGGPMAQKLLQRALSDDSIAAFYDEVQEDDKNNRPHLIFDILADYAPHKLMDRALRWYVDGQLKGEDIYQLGEDLEQLHQLQQRQIVQVYDVNQSNYTGLKGLLRKHEEQESESERQKAKQKTAQLFEGGDAKLMMEDDDWKVVRLNSKEAACELGKGTKWCTASEKHSMFDYYAKDGPLYILFDKKQVTGHPKLQISVGKQQLALQLMDPQDVPFPWEKIAGTSAGQWLSTKGGVDELLAGIDRYVEAGWQWYDLSSRLHDIVGSDDEMAHIGFFDPTAYTWERLRSKADENGSPDWHAKAPELIEWISSLEPPEGEAAEVFKAAQTKTENSADFYHLHLTPQAFTRAQRETIAALRKAQRRGMKNAT